MPRKATTALAVLLVFGTASVVLADTHDRTDDHGSLAQRPVSMMSNGRTGAIDDAAKPFTTEKKASFAAALAQSAPFCRGITGKTIVWIKLTEPGGKLIHIRGPRNFRQIRHANSWGQGSTRFDKREISRCAGKCRAGHAVDLGRPRRSRE